MTRDLPPGLATDVAVLEHSGSLVEDRGDHLIVRTPSNPTFHWGNCLLVTDAEAVADAGRWTTAFAEAFPRATWIAIGLVAMPQERAAWAAQGLGLELDDVLVTTVVPRTGPLPAGYVARELRTDDDWEQHIARELRDNADHEPVSHERFTRARTDSQRALTERGDAAFFGAFEDTALVADLGIVRCDDVARFQAVGTDAEHRRRGLASHLLGLAASWAADQGCREWVIVTEATNPAGRVYRAAGFELADATVQAYRAPGAPVIGDGAAH